MANRYAVETAFKLIDQATEPLNKIGVKGNAVGKALKNDFMKAQTQLSNMGRAAVRAGAAIAAAGVAAATAFAVKGVKDALEFESAFTRVATLADTSRVSLDQLRRGIMEVSNVTGIAAAELVELQYQAIGAGIDTADSVEFIASAARTARAAFTDTSVVADGLVKVLNAYQLEVSEADKIAGQMYLTTTLGNTSFEALNSSLGRVLPTASRLGVETDQLFASIAALTANSIETPRAMRGMEGILRAVQNPTDRMTQAAARLGIEFSATALRTQGLAGFLQDIQEKTGGCEDAIMALFGSVDALNVITTLTGDGAVSFASALEEMQGATDAVDRAFDIAMLDPAARWGRIMNTIKNTGISLGTALLPIVEKVMEKVEGFVESVKDFDFQPIADKAIAIFEKILGFAGHFINLAKFIWRLRVPILAIVGAIALYKGGMLLAALAVNAFTAAQNIAKGVQLVATLITGNQTKAMALYKAGTMGATIQTGLFWVRQKAVMGLNFAGTLIKQGAAFVALKAQLIAAKVATVAFAAAQKIAAVAIGAKTIALGILNALFIASPIGWIVLAIGALIAIIVLCVRHWDTITAALRTAWDWIKNVTSMIWDGLCNAFQYLMGFIKQNSDMVLGFITIFTGPFGFIISIVKELFDNWSAVVEVFKTDGIIEGFKRLGGVILSALLAPIVGLLDMLSKIPGVGRLLGPVTERLNDLRDSLRGTEIETTVVQEINPAGAADVTPRAVTQTTTAAASPVIPDYGFSGNTQTITAAAEQPTRPMTTAEQYRYSESTSREEVDIRVRAEPGTAAEVPRQARSPNVSVVHSGGN